MAELQQLGVHSEHIYLDQPGERPQDGLQLALQALDTGDTFVVARLARLARSLARIADLADQIDRVRAHLEVGRDRLTDLTPARLLQLAATAQIDMVYRALDDEEARHRLRLHDQRHTFHQVDVVHTVWLRQLFDAGMPRIQLGHQFGVSRATAFRIANEPLGDPE